MKTKNFTIITTVFLLFLTPLLTAGNKEIPGEIKKTIFKSLENKFYLKPYDEFSSKFSEYFPDYSLSDIWVNHGNGSTSTQHCLIQKTENGKTTNEVMCSKPRYFLEHLLIEKIVPHYKKQISSVDDIKNMMLAFYKAKPINKINNSTYHVHLGKDYFNRTHGFVITVDNNKIQSCKYQSPIE